MIPSNLLDSVYALVECPFLASTKYELYFTELDASFGLMHAWSIRPATAIV
jgi:hypothetical protein